MARRPVNSPYTITSEFGVPDSNALFKFHSGIDYAKDTGSPVFAPASGVIRYAQMHSVRGRMVGLFDGVNTHRLMHNSELLAKVGQQVAEAAVVARSGSTGLSTGPHVHWDILKGDNMDAASLGDFIDPAAWLNDNEGGQDMIRNFQDVDLLFLAVLNRYPESDSVRQNFIGLTWPDALQRLRQQDEYLHQNHILFVEYPKLKKEGINRESVIAYMQSNLK